MSLYTYINKWTNKAMMECENYHNGKTEIKYSKQLWNFGDVLCIILEHCVYFKMRV